ncbi:MAG: MCE family protein [Deltaproteobacteria bacterium]|nr:MCE family protein [Deltaproteobacteria bacterium]MCW5808016.1 MCE family protein [Deltaproteobacteria bacterium]
MRERGLEFKVGLLILVSSAILLGFIFVLGNFSLRPGFTVQVDFNYIGSLQPGAPIKVSGIKVGKVKDIEFFGGQVDPGIEQRVQVRVTAWIEDRARDSIRGDAEFFINTAGVLGEQYLEIVPGKDWERPPIQADAIIHDDKRVHDPPRTDLVVARLNEVLEGVSEVLREDRGSIKNLLANGASAVAEVNKMLVDNRAPIGDLITQGAGLAREAQKSLAKVNTGLGDGKMVATLLYDADQTLRTAQSTMTTLTPPAVALMTDATRVTNTITEARIDRAITAADKAAAAAGQAGGLIDNVNGLVTDLRSGKGTAGALLARDELYSDLRELIRDLKRNPWKLFWKE